MSIKIETSKAPAAIGPYSQATVVGKVKELPKGALVEIETIAEKG